MTGSTSTSAEPAIGPVVRARFLAAATLLVAPSGCSIFTSYIESTAPARGAFQSMDPARAAELLEPGTTSTLDHLAYRLERGTVLHTAGDLEDSSTELLEAASEIDAFDERAVVSATESAAVGASLLINEKTIPYEGESFERILVHAYLAMNFLFEGDPESARVEIRRLQQRQKDIRERAEEAGREAREEARKGGIDPSGVTGAVNRLYADQSSVASRVQNLYDDAFAYALSALVYEMNGEPNDAFIDLRRAMELRPELDRLKRDAYRAARASGLREDAAALEEVIGEDVRASYDAMRAGGTEIVVVFQAGDAPLKRQVGLPIPTGNGLVSIALPKYQLLPHGAARLSVRAADGSDLGATELYTDVEALAVRALRDRMAVLALKQAVRAVGKAVVSKQVSDELGAGGALLMSLWNLFSEQADLRGWTTLPANLQWLRIPVEPGEHRLRLVLETGRGGVLSERDVTVPVDDGEKRFVNVRATGPAVYVNVHPRPPAPEESP